MSDLFVDRPPPADGLAKLRTRIELVESRRVLMRRLSFAGASVLGVMIVVLATWSPDRRVRVEPASLDMEITRIRLGLAPQRDAPVRVPVDRRKDTAVQFLSASEDAVVYFVGVTTDLPPSEEVPPS